MENKSKKQIHRDKNGREFIKEAYFVGGKMKFHRIYVIEGIRVDEFYEKNVTNLDFYINGDYELINSENDSDNHNNVQSNNVSDSLENENVNNFPF